MTRHTEIEDTCLEPSINSLIEKGLGEGLARIAEILLNGVMLAERSAHLQARPHERTEDRTGYANGFKTSGLKTALGQLELRVPQVRDCQSPFRPSVLESGSRTDRALKAAIAEMYLQGVSTRRVSKIVEQLCGLEISSTQVSRLTSELDGEFEKWRTRQLEEIAYLILDATYIKVRVDGAVRDCAVLLAIGVRRSDGKRMVLGLSAALSEAEAHWRAFLNSLKARGIGLPDLITSDAHEGLRAALRAALHSVPWQRCQFHLQQNAQAYVPKVSMRRQVGADIRSIFNAPDLASAEHRLEQVAKKYRQSAPKLSEWMESNIPEGLTVFSLPEHVRTRLRTSNMAESLNKEIKRRTRVAGLFPNEASVLRLVTAIAMETSEEWEIGRAYLRTTSEEGHENSKRKA